MKYLKTKRSFRKEFKRQIRLALIAAVGFTIAFAWRNAIFSASQQFMSKVLDLAPDHYMNEAYTAITITVFGVLVIFISSKILKEK